MLQYVVCCTLDHAHSIGASAHVACCTGARCIGSRRVLHRCTLRVASVCAACCTGACCMLHRCASSLRSLPAAPSCDAFYGEWPSCGVCCACALLDWAKGGLCGGRAAVRCARAQGNGGGGVLSMVKGTALFDAVAISDTAAGVRARVVRL
jgi:hypothetical protein